jgi:peptidoglycan/LPS O-acetylase OafA/YrhL
MKSANIAYLPQIDHLRALAAIWIVIYHGEQILGSVLRYGKPFLGEWVITKNFFYSMVIEGHTAVALFMVLSGFIFTYGAYGKKIIYKYFLLNRLLRIYPLYILLIFVGMASNASGFSLLDFAANVLPLADFKTVSGGPFVSMSWAVAVEFQFYIIFPFILVAVNRIGPKAVVGLVAVAILFRVLGVLAGGDITDLTYWHLTGRIDQFLLGMLAAIGARTISITPKAALIGLISSAVMLIALLFAFNQTGGWPAKHAWKIIWPTVEGCVYGLIVFFYTSITPASLISRGFSAIGECSFSIYLLHFVIITIFSTRSEWLISFTLSPALNALISVVCIILPVTLGIAFLTFRVIEKPMLDLRFKYLQNNVSG